MARTVAGNVASNCWRALAVLVTIIVGFIEAVSLFGARWDCGGRINVDAAYCEN